MATLRKFVAIGHGPGALGGSWRPVAWMPVIDRIRAHLAELAADGPVRVVSSLEPGFPLMAAAAALIARDEGLPVSLAVVLAHPLPGEDREPKAIYTWVRRAWERADVRRVAFPRPPRNRAEVQGAQDEVARLTFEDAAGVLACWNGRRGNRTWASMLQAELRGLPVTNMYGEVAELMKLPAARPARLERAN